MNTFKGYSVLNHIPYDKFERIESIDVVRERATIVRDMDAVLDHIGIGSHLRGQTYRYETSLAGIPRDMLDEYLRELMAERRLLAERMCKNDELIKKIEEVLAE